MRFPKLSIKKFPPKSPKRQERRKYMKLRKQASRAGLLSCNTKRLNRYNPYNGKKEILYTETKISGEVDPTPIEINTDRLTETPDLKGVK